MPLYPKREDVLYYTGDTFTVEWYYTMDGELPGLEYYKDLTKGEQERLDYMVKYLADAPIGTTLPKIMYRVEDKKNRIYALKPAAHRFFNFTTHARRIIITNGYRKHAQKMTKQDRQKLNTAARYRADYLHRVKERTYYEKKN